MSPADPGPTLDVDRILATLDRHDVEYLLVGGVSCQAHGARRGTQDFDCLAATSEGNLTRLAAAMSELGARIRAEGLDDEESQGLHIPLDAETFKRMEISTWRTDAGDLDVLTDMPARDGRRLRYDDLVVRSTTVAFRSVAVRLASLDDIIASKEWADRPKDHEALDELRDIRNRAEHQTIA